MSVGGCRWKTAMFFPTSPCTARIARGAHNDAMQGSHHMAPTVNRFQPFTCKAVSNQESLFHINKTSTNNNPQIVLFLEKYACGFEDKTMWTSWLKKSEKVLMVLCLPHDHSHDICLKWSVLYIPGQLWGTVESAGSTCQKVRRVRMIWVWWLWQWFGFGGSWACIALGSQIFMEVLVWRPGFERLFFSVKQFLKSETKMNLSKIQMVLVLCIVFPSSVTYILSKIFKPCLEVISSLVLVQIYVLTSGFLAKDHGKHRGRGNSRKDQQVRLTCEICRRLLWARAKAKSTYGHQKSVIFVCTCPFELTNLTQGPCIKTS